MGKVCSRAWFAFFIISVFPCIVHAQIVYWGSIRESLQDTICLVQDEEQNLFPMFADRSACLRTKTELDEVVDAVLKEHRALFVSVPPAFEIIPNLSRLTYSEEERQGVDDPLRITKIVSNVGILFLEHRPFMETFLSLLQKELKKRGLTCPNCPFSLSQRHVRDVSWEEFAPYVAAFVEFRDGGYGICSGTEALEKMGHQKQGFLRAGFVSAYLVSKVRMRAGEFASGAPFENERWVGAICKDPEIKNEVCRILGLYKEELGVRIVNCP